MTTTYKEFGWNNESAANGESGFGLADVICRLIDSLEDVRQICDLGCGNGYLSGELANAGYEVTGVDASDAGLNIAKRAYGNATFIKSLIDVDHIKASGLGEFDLVCSSDVIEHLYRPSDLLDVANLLLKKDGRVLIGTPYHGYLKNLVLSLSGRMDAHFNVHHDGGHIKFFSVKTLSELLDKHGFTDLRFSFYGRAPWLWKNMICVARKSG